MRRALAYAAIAAFAAAAPASVGAQFNEPVYDLYWYQEATHQTLVGWARGECHEWGASSRLVWGHPSQYEVANQIGWCVDGEFQFL